MNFHLEFGAFLVDLGEEVPGDAFLGPRLVVEFGSTLFLGISNDICHRFKVARLRNDPFVDETLRILGEAQEKFPIRLQLIDGVNGFVYFRVQTLNLLLTRCTQQEVVHLIFQRVVDFHIDIVTSCLLVFRSTLNGDDVVDHDRIWWMQQWIQTLRNLGEFHFRTAENLLQIFVANDVLAFVGVLQLVRLDVLPQGGDDDWTSLSVDAQQPRQTRIQLELHEI